MRNAIFIIYSFLILMLALLVAGADLGSGTCESGACQNAGGALPCSVCKTDGTACYVFRYEDPEHLGCGLS